MLFLYPCLSKEPRRQGIMQNVRQLEKKDRDAHEKEKLEYERVNLMMSEGGFLVGERSDFFEGASL